MFLRKIAIAFVIATTPLLSSCIQYSALSEGSGYDPSAGTAIVVMAVQVGPVIDGEDKFSPNRVASIEGEWRSYDMTSERLRSSSEVARFIWKAGGSLFGTVERNNPTQYFVFELDPGSYVLTHTEKLMATPLGGHFRLKHFYLEHGDDPPSYTYDEGTPIVQSASPRFDVSAGEVIYLGAFKFSGSVRHTRLDGISTDLEAAQRYLRTEFPDVQPTLRHRPPSSRSQRNKGQTTILKE